MDKLETKEYNRKYYQEHKERIKNNVKSWRNSHPELVVKYSHKQNNSQKGRDRKDKWINNNIDKNRKIKEEWRVKNYEEHKQSILARNMAERKMKLDKECNICHSTEKLQRHHWNYDKPLLVNTLCQTCHQIQHIKHFEQSRFGRSQFG